MKIFAIIMVALLIAPLAEAGKKKCTVWQILHDACTDESTVGGVASVASGESEGLDLPAGVQVESDETR